MNGIADFFQSIPFFQSLAFGIIGMVIVGSSWCLVGLVMGDAPKKGIEPGLVQLFGAVFSVILSLLILICGTQFPEMPASVVLWTCGAYALGGFLNFFMLQLMSYAMQRGPNGVIWAIIQSGLIFPFIGGVMIFNVSLNAFRITGIILILIALGCFALSKDNTVKQNSGKNWRNSWKIPAFIALAIVAVQQNLTTAPSYYQSAQMVPSVARALATSGGALLAALIYEMVRMTPERKASLLDNLKNWTLWKYIGALQFFSLLFAYTLFYPGMDIMANHGLGGMCYPMMVGSCIVSFTLSSALILKEKFRPVQMLALLFCMLGLVFLCMDV